MKMIVGLGNPGSKYEQTKHNMGFMTMDCLADRHRFQFNKNKFEADYAEVFVNREKVIFVKPMTFMNLSGQAVLPLADYYGIDNKDILIVYDDLDLDVGQVRLRKKGSAGGQNGMKDVIKMLGSKEIKRARVGIGKPLPQQTVTQHVLSSFAEEDRDFARAGIDRAADAVEYWLQGHTFEEVMTQYNE